MNWRVLASLPLLLLAAQPGHGATDRGATDRGETDLAQTDRAQIGGAGAPSTAQPEPGTAPDTRTERQIRKECRAQGKARGLSGDGLHAAVSACVVAVRPDLALAEQCRSEGRAHHLHKAGLRAFVGDCTRARQ